jgi:hypothetical protein
LPIEQEFTPTNGYSGRIRPGQRSKALDDLKRSQTASAQAQQALATAEEELDDAKKNLESLDYPAAHPNGFPSPKTIMTWRRNCMSALKKNLKVLNGKLSTTRNESSLTITCKMPGRSAMLIERIAMVHR